MNPRLFGAIVIVGSGLVDGAVGGCRSEILPAPDLAAAPPDLSVPRTDLPAPVDLAVPPDFANSDLQSCCTFPGGPPEDLSGCVPITCILL